MRVYINKHLRELPDCFKTENRKIHQEYNLCPQCQTELCFVMEKPEEGLSFRTGDKNTFLFCCFSFEGKNYEIEYRSIEKAKPHIMYAQGIPEDELNKQIELLRQISSEEKQADEELQQFKKNRERPFCPVCHSTLMPYTKYNHPHTVRRNIKDGLITQEEYNVFFLPKEARLDTRRDKEISLEFLQFRLRQEDEKKAQKRRDALYSQFDVCVLSESACSIANHPEDLKKYISNLFTLETDIYSLSKRLVDLYVSQTIHARSVFRQKAICENAVRDQIANSKMQYETALDTLKRIRDVGREKVYVEKPIEPKRPFAPTLEKPGLFNKKKVLAHNAELTAEYERKCEQFEIDFAAYKAEFEACEVKRLRRVQEAEEKYNQAIAAAETEVEKFKMHFERENIDINERIQAACALPSPETVAKQMIDDEITRAEELLKNLLECRNKLYAYDIVFEKYRNLVALASFYEYLVAGRCRSLEGTNGAYNLFETECKTNQIIGQLTKIVDSLEQIKDNQYLVYSQLQKINSSLIALNSSMNGIAKSLNDVKVDTRNISEYMEAVAQNSEVIAHNAAVNTYYSKMNAELTNSLGYLIALH